MYNSFFSFMAKLAVLPVPLSLDLLLSGDSCQKVLQCHSSWLCTCPGNSCNIPWTWWLSPCAAVAPLQGSAWSLHVPSSCSPSHYQTVLAVDGWPELQTVTDDVQYSALSLIFSISGTFIGYYRTNSK